MRAALLIGLVGLAALPGGAAAASRTVESVSAGNVTAELSYIKQRADRFIVRFHDKRVKITRAGQVLRDDAVPSTCDSFCSPALASSKQKSIRLRDVNGDGEPEVLADFFTGGANCCAYTLAYGYQPATNTYARAARDFGHYGYRLRDLDGDGKSEFTSGDSRFYGLFSCGACGVLPIQLFDFDGTRFVNVTRHQAHAVHSDARRIYRGYLRTRRHGVDFVRGYLSPYVADECLLGRCRTGLRVVDRARRQGRLRRPRGGFAFGPYGSAYGRALKRLLRRYGYSR